MSKNNIKENLKASESQFKLIPIHKNLMVLAVVFFVLFIIKNQVSGYEWISNTFIKQNMEMIEKYPNLSVKEKGEVKMGFDFTYIDYVKTNTPENAVILFPPADVVLKDSTPDQPKFRVTGGGIYTRLWDQYYLYPRKVIFEDDTNTFSLKPQITHVAVVNYWGYDKLQYPVSQKSRLGVYPVKLNQ